MNEDNRNVLLVDDEPQIARALARSLADDFEVKTATSGAAAFEIMRDSPPFAAVISDMRMPEMDGATFLARVREISPSTVRVMLTGYAELEAATRAINEGQIFRFLSKPCLPKEFRQVVQSAVDQHQLLILEEALLRDTLRGAIEVMSQVLELVNPSAFGRSSRVRALVKHMVSRMGLREPWQYDTAALLCQLGCVSLPQDLLERRYANTPLTKEEEELYHSHPKTAETLLQKIPRLEGVAEMVAKQLDILDFPVPEGGRVGPQLGAEILHIAGEYERLVSSGMGHGAAKQVMESRILHLSPGVYRALKSIPTPALHERVHSITLKELVPGMEFLDDLRESGGTLILAAGHVSTTASVYRLKEMATTSWDIIQPFRVRLKAAEEDNTSD